MEIAKFGILPSEPGGNDTHLRRLAISTLKGTALDFLIRLIKREPEISFDNIATKLKKHYDFLIDSRCAKQTLHFCFGISLFKSLDLVILNLLSQAHCRHF